jgi:hypothetical protein
LFPSAYLDRWSCYRYKAVPRRNSSRVFPLTYCVIGPSQWLVVTHQRGCSPRLVWIVDPVIDMSQWLIVTRQGFPLDLLWIVDPVIGTSQWLVVTHQGVFPLGFSVCRSARSHAYDSGVRLFLEREFCVSWIIIWPLSAIPGRWPWDIHIRRITLCQWHGINIYSMNIYMCQWHGLVYSVTIAVSVTQTSLIWWLCVNDTVTYIRWIAVCQWHRIVYSMNICVSMTQNCTFDECLCVNDTKWDLSTMSKNWPSAILIVCDRLGQPYDVWLV